MNAIARPPQLTRGKPVDGLQRPAEMRLVRETRRVSGFSDLDTAHKRPRSFGGLKLEPVALRRDSIGKLEPAADRALGQPVGRGPSVKAQPAQLQIARQQVGPIVAGRLASNAAAHQLRDGRPCVALCNPHDRLGIRARASRERRLEIDGQVEDFRALRRKAIAMGVKGRVEQDVAGSRLETPAVTGLHISSAHHQRCVTVAVAVARHALHRFVPLPRRCAE